MTTLIPVMIGAEETYNSRCREIERFFEMLQFMRDNRDSRLCSSPTVEEDLSIYVVGRDLEKTLRASAYLMLYNLVEATMTNAIDAIHLHIAGEQVGFDELKEDLRRIAIKGLRKAVSSSTPSELLDVGVPISSALIWLGFDKKDLFSGNLDGRLIKDTAKEYGFELVNHDKTASRDGARLLNVKTKRNELAHGGISFEDCGQDTSVDELVAIFDEIKVFIKAVLDGVSDYLSSKGYLHVDNASSAAEENLSVE
ncbi:MAE_28990/MAE_18760 family HEPN-like nuclease [Alcanivorax sp. S6407]|uniref:MAE_28990/MAE_18760 family HEPN-like nuclease n=1 Tax=Alcanivorax sp. S6407 TaxID=2926424 RepID=UPI001FF1DE92|nr:MAE_28990/MAE_18760 family HEPN-like nuclease [Alcanivorax sp. S6407]MCK0154900.1 MAE_28990/MAE_18760 family HEPN-like nuclease [Alcanivorax sp. S6407]